MFRIAMNKTKGTAKSINIFNKKISSLIIYCIFDKYTNIFQ